MNRIGVVLFGYPLGVSETIVLTVQALCRAGNRVDVLIDPVAFALSPVCFDTPEIRIIQVPLDKSPGGGSSAGWPHGLPGLDRFLEATIRFPRYPIFIDNLHRVTAETSYDLIVGVEPFGLVASHALGLRHRCAVVYYNMELFQRSNCGFSEQHLLKDLEIEASRRCWLTVIPDEHRAKVYAEENGVDPRTIRHLPISASGPVLTGTGDYFRKKFDIPPDRKLILYAGHLADWALCREIVSASRDWPEAYALVLHTWKPDADADPFVGELKRLARSNVFFSTEPLPRDRFPQALSSADVGLMFYRPIDENFTEIGSSSNKLAQYLRAGVPVVASDHPSIRRVFHRYRCGICVPDPEGIQGAAFSILADHDGYRCRAHRAYEERYRFERFFSPIQEEIQTYLNFKPQQPQWPSHPQDNS